MRIQKVFLICFISLILASLTMPALGQAADKPPVKCLMMGLGTHNDDNLVETLDYIKEHYPSVAITATEDIEALRYENLKKFDVLAINRIKAENGNPPDFVIDGIVRFLQEGGGLLANHFCVANVQNWRDSIDILGAMWVSGKSTHNPYHEFRVDIKDESHPILEGIKPFTTNDELYFNLLMRPDMNIIMTAYEERFGRTVAEPMLATHYFYNARCVYFALGHDAVSCKAPEYRQIMVQAIEWAACRR